MRPCRPFSGSPTFDFYRTVLKYSLRLSNEEVVTWKRLRTPIYNSTHVTARAEKNAASMMKTSPSLVPKSKGVPGVDDIAVLEGKGAKPHNLKSEHTRSDLIHGYYSRWPDACEPYLYGKKKHWGSTSIRQIRDDKEPQG